MLANCHHREASSLRTLPPGRTSTHPNGSITSIRSRRRCGSYDASVGATAQGLCLLVGAVQVCACDRVLEQVEPEKGRACVLAEIELVDVHRVDGDVITMRAV